MLNKIATRMTSYMIIQGVVPQEDEEIYVFGWTMLLFSVGSFAALLIIGAFFGQLLETAIFLLSFTFLRSYAGGYHSTSFGRCFLITSSLFGSCLLLRFYLPQVYWDWAVLISLVLSVIITFVWAPMDHPNKPFRGNQREVNKRASRITVVLQTFLILGLRAWQPWLLPYLLWAALGMAITSLTLLFVICRPYKEV